MSAKIKLFFLLVFFALSITTGSYTAVAHEPTTILQGEALGQPCSSSCNGTG